MNSINRTIFGIETSIVVVGLKCPITLSIAPSLELKQNSFITSELIQPPINRTIFGIETMKFFTHTLQVFLLSIAPSLELKRGNATGAGKEVNAINRTIFGIETAYSLLGLQLCSLSINRTIFGIETRNLNWISSRTWLSIAPSLELKHTKSADLSRNMYLSIAPSLELKLKGEGWFSSAGRAINRTIFGIETGYDYNDAPTGSLSIAPSLELKLALVAAKIILATAYQSHHLWNWNA